MRQAVGMINSPLVTFCVINAQISTEYNYKGERTNLHFYIFTFLYNLKTFCQI